MLKKARAGFRNKISLDHKNICNFFIHKLFVSYSILIGTKTISVVYLSCFWWNLFMYFWHFEVQLSYEVSMIALSKVNFPPVAWLVRDEWAKRWRGDERWPVLVRGDERWTVLVWETRIGPEFSLFSYRYKKCVKLFKFYSLCFLIYHQLV
jgi:hypothetical protein